MRMVHRGHIVASVAIRYAKYDDVGEFHFCLNLFYRSVRSFCDANESIKERIDGARAFQRCRVQKGTLCFGTPIPATQTTAERPLHICHSLPSNVTNILYPCRDLTPGPRGYDLKLDFI